jgi:hypothetical protein
MSTIKYYTAPVTQKGHGFGGIFKGLAKFITPVLSGLKSVATHPVVQSVAKEAVKTGISVVADKLEGKPVKAFSDIRKKIASTIRDFDGTNNGQVDSRPSAPKRYRDEAEDYSDDGFEVVSKWKEEPKKKSVKRPAKRSKVSRPIRKSVFD